MWSQITHQLCVTGLWFCYVTYVITGHIAKFQGGCRIKCLMNINWEGRSVWPLVIASKHRDGWLQGTADNNSCICIPKGETFFFFFLKKSNLCFLKEPPLLLEYIGSGRQSSYGRLSVLYQGHLRGFTKEKVSQEDAFLFDNDLPPPLRCW